MEFVDLFKNFFEFKLFVANLLGSNFSLTIWLFVEHFLQQAALDFFKSLRLFTKLICCNTESVRNCFAEGRPSGQILQFWLQSFSLKMVERVKGEQRFANSPIWFPNLVLQFALLVERRAAQPTKGINLSDKKRLDD